MFKKIFTNLFKKADPVTDTKVSNLNEDTAILSASFSDIDIVKESMAELQRAYDELIYEHENLKKKFMKEQTINPILYEISNIKSRVKPSYADDDQILQLEAKITQMEERNKELEKTIANFTLDLEKSRSQIKTVASGDKPDDKTISSLVEKNNQLSKLVDKLRSDLIITNEKNSGLLRELHNLPFTNKMSLESDYLSTLSTLTTEDWKKTLKEREDILEYLKDFDFYKDTADILIVEFQKLFRKEYTVTTQFNSQDPNSQNQTAQQNTKLQKRNKELEKVIKLLIAKLEEANELIKNLNGSASVGKTG